VHAYTLGFPLLGDTLYSAPETELISRPALHAWSLSIRDPQSGEKRFFHAGYPADFAAALVALGIPADEKDPY
jgi:23S rRNA-/tRNA-specific pseudouridylate synthase